MGDLLGEVEDRHALQHDMPRPGQHREEQALAAEQHVLKAGDPLDVELHARVDRTDMPGMDEEPLAGREIALDDLAREVEKRGAGTAHLLQDKALAAEKPGADALLPGDLQ